MDYDRESSSYDDDSVALKNANNVVDRCSCISLVSAIKEKYGCCDLQPSSDDNDNGKGGGFRHHSTMAVFMKVESIEDWSSKRRELIVLNERNIDSAGDLEILSDLLLNVTDLDLSKNRFDAWTELRQIFLRTPLLKHCDLSYNSSLKYSEFSLDLGLNLNKLQSLVLNATHISWSSILNVLQAAPCLDELHLSFNDYSNVMINQVQFKKGGDDDQIFSFPTVHVLYLNRCRIASWHSLLKICQIFPCLEILIAPENPIAEIDRIENSSLSRPAKKHDEKLSPPILQADVFSSLHSLNMNRWSLSDWSDIDKLRNLPLLNELRASGLPLLESYGENERRMLLIARLPDLTLLNGSLITPTNREDAERFFIRYYLDSTEKPDRFFELVNQHGYLNKLLDVDLSPKRYADVRLVYEDQNRVETKRINLNQTVAQFKKSLRNFCDLPPNKIRLWYMDVEAVDILGMDELRYPGVMLHALRVADGDEFHIQAKPEHHVTRRKPNSGSSGCDRTSSNNN